MPVVEELVALLGFKVEGEAKLAKFKKGLNDVEQSARRTGTAIDHQSKRLGKLEGGYNSVAAAGAKMLGAIAAGGIVKDTLGEAIKIEKAMVNVQRAADLDTAGLANVKREIFGMSEALGKAPDALADIYTMGAKAGVPLAELSGYTTDIVKNSTAWDVALDETAEKYGTIQKLFRANRGEMQATAGAINAVADGLAGKVNEGDVLKFTSEIAEASRRIKVTAKESAALGGTFLSLGVNADQASTGINSALFRVLENAKELKKGPKEALTMLGLDPDQLQAAVRSKGMSEILKFLDALNAHKDKGGIARDLFGLEHMSKILTLAGNLDTLRQAIGLTSDDQKNTANLEKGYALKSGTTAGQIEKAWANIAMAQDRAANAYLPSINAGLGQMNALLKEGGGAFDAIADGAKDTMEAVNAFGDLMNRYKKAKEAGSANPLLVAATGAVTDSFKAGLEEREKKQAMSDRVDEVLAAQGKGPLERAWNRVTASDEARAGVLARHDPVTIRTAPALAPWLPVGSNIPKPRPSARVASAFDAVPSRPAAAPATTVGAALAQPTAAAKVDTSSAQNALQMLRDLDGSSATAKAILDVASFLDPANQALGLLRDMNTSVTARITADISDVEVKVARAKELVKSVQNLSVGAGSAGGSAPTPARVAGAGAAP